MFVGRARLVILHQVHDSLVLKLALPLRPPCQLTLACCCVNSFLVVRGLPFEVLAVKRHWTRHGESAYQIRPE